MREAVAPMVRDSTQRRQATLGLASRGDALTPYLLEALRRRFTVTARIDPELTYAQRLLVAALTFRARRHRWVERFYKSGTAWALRTANGARQLHRLGASPDAILQVHLLFDLPGTPALIYVDCTHRQAAEQWPAWNPLTGRALKQWYRRERHSYASSRHLFAFSEPTRQSLMLDYGIPSAKITVVGAGANLHRLPVLKDPTAAVAEPVILFIGNDFERKGGRVLLEAFRSVRTRLPDARLVIVGTPAVVEPQDGVTVLGRVHDREHIARLYAQASVFALPSYFDPYPLVLLEAMAFGLPVVSTRQTGVPEMVSDGQTGRLVDPGDVGQLAEALHEVLTDPDLGRTWGAQGRRLVEQRHTWDAVVDRMAPALLGDDPDDR